VVESRDGVGVEADFDAAEVVGELVFLGGLDDGDDVAGPAQQPGERDLGRTPAALFGDLQDGGDDVLLPSVRLVVPAVEPPRLTPAVLARACGSSSRSGVRSSRLYRSCEPANAVQPLSSASVLA
jgi:hypothetical protein